MAHALSTRLGRIGLVVALLAGVLAVSFGTGYRASQAVLDSGSAYVTKGHTVVRVNGESRRVDAELTGAVARGKERLKVVELPDGQLYVENTTTGTRAKVDTTTMTPQPLPRARADAAGSVVGGGSETYSVDRASGAVGWFHPRTRQLTPVATLGPVQGVEVDSAGTAWVLAGGKLHPVHRTEQRPAVPVGDAGEPALLTLVGDRPTVLRPAAGEAVRLGAGDVQRARVPDLAGRSADELAVAAPGPGDTLWVVSRQGLDLVGVDLPTGQVRSVELARRGQQVRNGAPVVAGRRVLVPDYKARAVHVVEAASAREGRPIVKVPGTRDFDLTVRGSKVFINDQYAGEGMVVDGDRTGTVDKGTGDGLDGPRPPAATDPERRPVAPRPPDRPGAGDRDADRRPGGGEPVRPVPAPTTPPPVAVPEVVGLDRQAACAALRAVRLDCVEVPVGNDGAGATGLVLRTAPAAGATVPVGQVVTVSYRGDIQLPDLAGLPSAAACSALEAAGLVCERVELPAAADAAAVDKVSAQDPAPGTPARTGDRVRVSYPTQVLVPDVRTLGVADACARLATAGLACTQVDAGTRPTTEPPGVVIDQAPAAGAAAVPGTATTVRFYGSVRVPTVAGLDPAAAQAAIAAAGLTPVPVPDAITNRPNVVLSQTPAPDTPAAPGTQVQYVYENTAPTVQVRLGKKSAEFRYTLEVGRAGYVDQRLFGFAFAEAAGGTTPVYRYVCSGGQCGGAGTFYYSMTNVPAYDPGWVNDGIAFHAYAEPQQTAGMVAIRAMFDGTAWVWALPGSAEYATYVGRGYRDQFPVGWVWPTV